MIRAVAACLVSLLATVLLGVWLFAPPDPLPARFAHADCRRIVLVDPATGAQVVGAEDLALAPDGDTLIVSAHDRRAPGRPEGGLYAASLWSLGAGGPVTATPLVDRAARAEPLRPHGIALAPDGRRLAVVNRPAPATATVEIGRLTGTAWTPERRLTGARLCRANDLAYVGDDVLRVSLDRADCTTSLRDLWPWGGTGSLARIAGGEMSTIRTGLAFPNGVAGRFVAETRAGRILRPDGPPIEVPGGPDNLTRTADGALVAAVHPRLAQLWFYLQGWLGRAPSRILRVAPADGAVEVLFDDPDGALFSAAATAVLAGGRLVAGSVGDAGLLHCRGGGA